MKGSKNDFSMTFYNGGRRTEVEKTLRDTLEKAIRKEAEIGKKTGVRR